MAQYQAFAPDVEISGHILQATLLANPTLEPKVRSIMAEKDLAQFEEQGWYNMQDYLDVVKELGKEFGPSLLFAIGKSISQCLLDQEHPQSLHEALQTLDEMYRANHRGHNIGYYHLLSYSPDYKEAKVECKNPYPCFLDRGILTALSKQFKPKEAQLINVEVDDVRPQRLAGNDASYYNILWV
ncbi:MAG: hypothetical protein HC913_01095 [Microscillaceae bacterium]|nr:hypothetical protein [Microscillaceae bacterium]